MVVIGVVGVFDNHHPTPSKMLYPRFLTPQRKIERRNVPGAWQRMPPKAWSRSLTAMSVTRALGSGGGGPNISQGSKPWRM